MKKKCVVLLSGGLDSAVVLAKSVQEFECHALAFKYGQRHGRELQASIALAHYYKVPFKSIYVQFPTVTALLEEGSDVNKMDEKTNLPASFVPGRNLTFLSLAANLAYQLEADFIAGGWNATDYPGYPDCRPPFLDSAENAISLGLGRPIKIFAPAVLMKKAEIVESGAFMGVPFELTWSCYEGGEKPCGKCSSCKYRAEAFKAIGIDDPAL